MGTICYSVGLSVRGGAHEPASTLHRARSNVRGTSRSGDGSDLKTTLSGNGCALPFACCRASRARSARGVCQLEYRRPRLRIDSLGASHCLSFGRAASSARRAIQSSYSGVPRRGGHPSAFRPSMPGYWDIVYDGFANAGPRVSGAGGQRCECNTGDDKFVDDLLHGSSTHFNSDLSVTQRNLFPSKVCPRG